MRRGTHWSSVVITLVATLLVAACGSSAKTSSSSQSSSSSSSSSSGRTAEELAADQQTAQTIVLKIADFPTGWEAKPRPPSTADSGEAKAAAEKIADCLGVDPSFIDDEAEPDKAKARSDKFDSGDQSVESTVTVQESVEHKDEILTAFRKPEAVGCFESFFNEAVTAAFSSSASSLPSGTQIGKPSVKNGDLSGLHGDAVTFQATVPFTVEGLSFSLVTEFVFVLKGRTTFDFTFDNFDAPFPADLAVQLANASIDRAPDS